jgi:predicted DNA-binding transcriptional regulator AlpA
MSGISNFYCDHCGKETHFVPIHRAIEITGVTRSTVYYWIDKDWVHWVKLPSNRTVICEESLHYRQAESIQPLMKGAAA